MRRFTTAIITIAVCMAFFGTVVRPAAAQGNTTTYIVQPGDNLYRIALKFNLSPYYLAQINGIVNPNYILVGQQLTIPVSPQQGTPAATIMATMAVTLASTQTATTAATMAPTSGGSSGPTTTATPVPQTTPQTYTVQAGDNLYRISLKFNTSMFVLAQLNGLFNPNLIFVGQVLRLPGFGTGQPVQPVTTPATPRGTAEATVTGPVNNTVSNIGFAFGMDVELQGQDVAATTSKVTDLGVTWVKQRASWKVYEPTKGNIDFAALDSQINALSGGNVKILLTVSRAPDWARSTNAEDGPPTDFNDYANFVGQLAAHYKGKVAAYEVWEKPNVRREWDGRPLSAASYVEMLRLAYAAIKKADSGVVVVSAGLAPTGFDDGVNAINDRTFLKQAYAAGLGSYADAIGAQPTGWANPPDSSCCIASPGVTGWYNDRSFYFKDTLIDYRQIMSQNNATSKFIWVTDFGWGSNDGVVAAADVNDQLFGFVKFINQGQQAQYVARGFEIGGALGFVGPMFLSNLNGCQASTAKADCFYSLLDKDGNARPAYTAIKTAKK